MHSASNKAKLILHDASVFIQFVLVLFFFFLSLSPSAQMETKQVDRYYRRGMRAQGSSMKKQKGRIHLLKCLRG